MIITPLCFRLVLFDLICTVLYSCVPSHFKREASKGPSRGLHGAPEPGRDRVPQRWILRWHIPFQDLPSSGVLWVALLLHSFPVGHCPIRIHRQRQPVRATVRPPRRIQVSTDSTVNNGYDVCCTAFVRPLHLALPSTCVMHSSLLVSCTPLHLFPACGILGGPRKVSGHGLGLVLTKRKSAQPISRIQAYQPYFWLSLQ